MALNDDIDLTLESIFYSQEENSVQNDAQRRYRSLGILYNLFETNLKVSMMRWFDDIGKPSDNIDCLRSNYRLLEDQSEGCYFEIFKTVPETSWLNYGFGVGCDCCGIELNPLNRGKYFSLCLACDDFENERHETFFNWGT